MVQNS